jgi:mono/diheme cytochrome c family protein
VKIGWALALFIPLAAAAASPPDAYRGMRLYDANCGACHSATMHERMKSKVRDLADLRAEVLRWSAHAQHTFTDQEIDDLVAYLNRWHYRLGGRS